MNASNCQQQIWNGIYATGTHLNRYPYDFVVNFVFRNFPKNKPKKDVTILEIGCGAGNNLWFTAKEGFNSIGCDFSFSSIQYGFRRIISENLHANFAQADFAHLPFKENRFDLIIDRGALTCVKFNEAQRTIASIRELLKFGGRFLFNPYCISHTSYASGTSDSDGLTRNIRRGTLQGIGNICFYSKEMVASCFSSGWKVINTSHYALSQEFASGKDLHSEWRIIAEKEQIQ